MPPTPRSPGSVAKRRIVVDADVAQSVGMRRSASDLALRCRACLDAILDICHSVVMGEELERQWRKHESRYSSWWLVSMKQRGKYCKVAGAVAAETEFESAAQESAAARKDVHLLLAAAGSDGVVVSRDDKARKALAKCCGHLPGVPDIVWACPEHDAGVVEWLEQGAPSKPEWTLGQGQTT